MIDLRNIYIRKKKCESLYLLIRALRDSGGKGERGKREYRRPAGRTYD